jgi:predicted regulator of Ras-like GTPase activity (Roadblock/LC7/MglB family)
MMDDRARRAFVDVIGEGDQTVLLLDSRGVVTAGVYIDSEGRDVSSEIGRALADVGSEARRAMRHLPLGGWCAIVFECDDANLAIAPADGDEIVLVAASPEVPVGFVRRLLDRAVRRALSWRREVA